MGSILSSRGFGGNRRAGSCRPVLSLIEGLTTGFYDGDLLVRQVVEVTDALGNFSVGGAILPLKTDFLAPMGSSQQVPSYCVAILRR